MNGWISKTWIMRPTTRPSSEPTRIDSGMTTAGRPALLEQVAASTPDRAATAPTDRSMPPVRMTKVMPTAMTMRKALLMNRLEMTAPDRKLS